MGVIILTGCAHPGVDKILEISKSFGRIYGIIGGFHGFKDFELLRGISLIVPCHCTRYKKKIKNLFAENFITGGIGFKIIFDTPGEITLKGGEATNER